MSDPVVQTAGMKTMISVPPQSQMQLVLPAPPTPYKRRSSRPCSQARARWWFDQIHRAIESVPDAGALSGKGALAA